MSIDSDLPISVTPKPNGHTSNLWGGFGKHPRRPDLKQATELRNITFDIAMDLAKTEVSTLDDKVARAQGVARLMQGWEGACDRIRIIRGKPLPGSRRPAPDKPKRKPAGFASVGDLHKLEPVSEPDVAGGE